MMVVRAAVLLSVMSIAALHVLRPDLSPTGSRLSLYATGRQGWLMALAFGAVTAALVALALRIHSDGDRRPGRRPATAALTVAAAGMALSGVFRVAISPASAMVHSRASAAAVVALVAAALLWSVYPRWRIEGAAGLGVEGWLAVAVAVLAFLGPLLHHSRWTGLSQRALWLAVAAWVLSASFATSSAEADPDGS